MIRMPTLFFHLVLFFIVLALTACTDNSSPPKSATAELPAELFSAAPLENALPLCEIKAAGKPGDEVVFSGVIGGRSKPFTEGRAVMLISDESLPFCVDKCRTPWDACCETSKSIIEKSATVQVVDDKGNPLKVGFAEKGKLKPGDKVQIQGKISQVGEGLFIVTVNKIHLQ